MNRIRGRATLAAAACAMSIQMLGCRADGATAPTSASYAAELTGANERPIHATGGHGTATIDVVGDHAGYVVTASGLTSPVTVAHILIGGSEAAPGQVVVRLTLVASGDTVAMGDIDLSRPITFNTTTISADSLRSLFERGTAYVNVYTATYPDGEMRGQIARR